MSGGMSGVRPVPRYEIEVHHREVAAEGPGHRRGLARQSSRPRIDAGQVGEVGAGQAAVAVPGQHGVDRGQGGDGEAGVVGHVARVGAARSGMAERHHDVGSGRADIGQVPRHGIDSVARREIAAQHRRVPDRGLGWCRRHEPDAQVVQRAIAIGEAAGHDAPGRDDGRVRARLRPQRRDKIGAEHRKAGGVDRAAQRAQPIVEIVVAERHGVVADRVHGADHRVDVAGPGLRHRAVGQRRALQDVAAIHEQAVGVRAPFRIDQRGDARKAAAGGGCVGLVVEGPQVAMQVGAAQDAKPERAAPGDCWFDHGPWVPLRCRLFVGSVRWCGRGRNRWLPIARRSCNRCCACATRHAPPVLPGRGCVRIGRAG